MCHPALVAHQLQPAARPKDLVDKGAVVVLLVMMIPVTAAMVDQVVLAHPVAGVALVVMATSFQDIKQVVVLVARLGAVVLSQAVAAVVQALMVVHLLIVLMVVWVALAVLGAHIVWPFGD